LVYKYQVDASSASFDYWSAEGKMYSLGYPIAEAVVRLNLRPAKIQLSAAASKRSPTFFERFGWSGGFVSNPDLKEETRVEGDIGVSADIGLGGGGSAGVALSVFGGKVDDKIKSIPRNNFVKVMNFADTDFWGAELDINSKLFRVITAELNATYMNSVISGAADKSWVGRAEPFVPAFSGYLKAEIDIWRIGIGHGIKYESECYLSIENIVTRDPRGELSAWLSYKAADFLTLRYRVDNYLNAESFDFMDNPAPKRTHVLSAGINF
jgi:outer membrane cobalamin receptor